MKGFSREGHKQTVSDESPRDLIVRIVEPLCRPVVSPIERLTVSSLRREGPMPLNLLVERVASELYFEELRNGAWALDIGLFRERLFVPDVVKEIQEQNGTLWRIENLRGS